MKKLLKHIMDNIFVYIVVVAFVSLFVYFIRQDLKKWNMELVHWHMNISYDICGNKDPLPKHWKEWIVHGHEDGKIHIEWYVDKKNRKETLWMYFDSLWVKFNDTQIANIQNGYKCPWSNKWWILKVIVNWKQIKNVRDYILQKDDDIKIIFN